TVPVTVCVPFSCPRSSAVAIVEPGSTAAAETPPVDEFDEAATSAMDPAIRTCSTSLEQAVSAAMRSLGSSDSSRSPRAPWPARRAGRDVEPSFFALIAGSFPLGLRAAASIELTFVRQAARLPYGDETGGTMSRRGGDVRHGALALAG